VILYSLLPFNFFIQLDIVYDVGKNRRKFYAKSFLFLSLFREKEAVANANVK
jgi:hypothetical protein